MHSHSELTVATNSVDYVVFVSKAHVATPSPVLVYIFVRMYMYVRTYNVWSRDFRSSPRSSERSELLIIIASTLGLVGVVRKWAWHTTKFARITYLAPPLVKSWDHP